jgi:hypothetical protein
VKRAVATVIGSKIQIDSASNPLAYRPQLLELSTLLPGFVEAVIDENFKLFWSHHIPHKRHTLHNQSPVLAPQTSHFALTLAVQTNHPFSGP